MPRLYDPSSLESLLRTAREMGYTKGDVANDLGVHRGTLSAWITSDPAKRQTPLEVYQKQFEGLERKYRRKKGPKYREVGTIQNGIEQIDSPNGSTPNDGNTCASRLDGDDIKENSPTVAEILPDDSHHE